MNFPRKCNSGSTSAAAQQDEADGSDESSFEVRPLIHPQKPTDITITVRERKQGADGGQLLGELPDMMSASEGREERGVEEKQT